MPKAPEDLAGLLDLLKEAGGQKKQVPVSALMELIGRRSFGPLLVLAGVIILTPVVGDIPGVPTTIGIVVVLLVGQILVGRNELWLPQWLLDRTIERKKLEKLVSFANRPARWFDRMTRPRLSALTRSPWDRILGGLALLVGLIMPLMEVIPFSANAAGLILTLLGLSLIARDGLLALLAMIVTAVGLVLLVMALL